MLQLAGRLLREAIVGLKDLDLKHNEQGQAFGLRPARAATEDPPFKLSTPADELLVQMLASHDSRRLDAGQWLRQNFDQAKRHDDGLAAGALAACEELIRQLEPKDLEGRFERSAKRNLMGARPVELGALPRAPQDPDRDAGAGYPAARGGGEIRRRLQRSDQAPGQGVKRWTPGGKEVAERVGFEPTCRD